jgi:flagellar motor switch protein FliN/FliY
MTAQPVAIPTPGATETRSLAVGAAAAALPVIPSAQPLTVAPDHAGEPAGLGYVATFTGTRSGEVAVILDETVRVALETASLDVSVEDAVRPALEAASGSLGPCVLGPVRAASAEELNQDGVTLVALVAGGSASAWVGLKLRSETGSPVSPATGRESLTSGFGLHLLRDVEMTLSVEIGRARMTVRELLQLSPGSVVELDRAAGAPADLLVNGRLIARGEVVVVDEDFGLRITELVQPPGETTV